MTPMPAARFRGGTFARLLLGVALVLAAACGMTACRSTDIESAGIVQQSREASTASGVTPVGMDGTATAGLSIRVVGVSVGVDATKIEMVVEGRPDLGDQLHATGLPVLTDSSGAIHHEYAGNADGRTLTLSFPGSASVQPGPALLRIPGLWLIQGRLGSGIMFPPSVARVEIKLDIPAAGGAVLHIPVEAGGTLAFGSATVASMSRDASSLVVSGVFGGFTREQIQAMGVRACLILADGTEVPMVGGRMGFGAHLEQFEYRFNVSNTTIVTDVEFRLETGQIPGSLQNLGPQIDAALNQLEAASGATLRVPLPR